MDWGSAIAAGGAIADLFGGGGSQEKKRYIVAAQQAQLDRDYQLYGNQIQMDFVNRWNERSMARRRTEWNLARGYELRAIQDRVADARAAGLHPLFALGAAGTSMQPGPFVAGQPAGGSVGSAGLSYQGQDEESALRRFGRAARGIGETMTARRIEKRQQQLQERMQAAGLAKTEAETALTLAETQAVLSRVARANSQNNSNQDGNAPKMYEPEAGTHPGRYNTIPAEVESARVADKAVAAGPAGPGYRQKEFGGGVKLDVPGQELMENEVIGAIAMVARNVAMGIWTAAQGARILAKKMAQSKGPRKGSTRKSRRSRR